MSGRRGAGKSRGATGCLASHHPLEQIIRRLAVMPGGSGGLSAVVRRALQCGSCRLRETCGAAAPRRPELAHTRRPACTAIDKRATAAAPIAYSRCTRDRLCARKRTQPRASACRGSHPVRRRVRRIAFDLARGRGPLRVMAPATRMLRPDCSNPLLSRDGRSPSQWLGLRRLSRHRLAPGPHCAPGFRPFASCCNSKTHQLEAPRPGTLFVHDLSPFRSPWLALCRRYRGRDERAPELKSWPRPTRFPAATNRGMLDTVF